MAWELMASTCMDGDCPKIHRNVETGAVRLRGADPADPTQERDIEISGGDWRTLLAQLLR